ncbi:MAG: hypothetical protein QOJ63_3662 [Solirubrobacteraceae bacterium]|nr:hypothetical protein [Solirubrobacteraceae bacterium]
MAGIDGMRFVVPVHGIHARPNPTYFGRRRGATWLNLLNDQAVGLAARVLSGTPRDPLHMIDLIYSRTLPAPRRHHHRPGPTAHIVFALITLLGFDYRPQLADLPDAKLWRIVIGADYGPLNAAARGKIDLARIERQWPDIVRVVASDCSHPTTRSLALPRALPLASAPVIVVHFALRTARAAVSGGQSPEHRRTCGHVH